MDWFRILLAAHRETPRWDGWDGGGNRLGWFDLDGEKLNARESDSDEAHALTSRRCPSYSHVNKPPFHLHAIAHPSPPDPLPWGGDRFTFLVLGTATSSIPESDAGVPLSCTPYPAKAWATPFHITSHLCFKDEISL